MMSGAGILPVARVVSPQPVVILGTATPAAPFEPGRRVTPGRQADLAPNHRQRFARSTYRRGRLIDLSI
jgi:hypothetical protein